MTANILIFAGLFTIAWLLCFLLKREPEKAAAYALGIAILSNILFRPYIGIKQPGHWFELPSDYEVVLKRHFVSPYSGRPVIADVLVKSETIDEAGRGYYVKWIRPYEGGVFTFPNNEVSLTTSTPLVDVYGKIWRIHLIQKER